MFEFAQTKRAASRRPLLSCLRKRASVTTAIRDKSPLGLLDCPVKPGNDNLLLTVLSN
jgi:hypothetical protein